MSTLEICLPPGASCLLHSGACCFSSCLGVVVCDAQALQVGLVPKVVTSRYPYASRHDVVHYIARLVAVYLAERLTLSNTQSQGDAPSCLVYEMEWIVAAVSVVLSARLLLAGTSADALTTGAVLGRFRWHRYCLASPSPAPALRYLIPRSGASRRAR